LVLVIAFTWLVALSACGYHGPSYVGRTFEVTNATAAPKDWKLVPLPDTEVLVVWSGNLVDNPVDSTSICLAAVVARTDKDGWIRLPGWWAHPQGRWITDVEPHGYAWRPGYTYLPLQTGMDSISIMAPGVMALRKAPSSDQEIKREDAFGAARYCPNGPHTR